ncbi:class I SAM-dependent methyltransferase [Piscinibacter sp.]|jgi:SAM-dependent methyltransferase|uniref:class I SAM-dependent methyltransferase n=1 Tax=Piscinibacter sp. TaxID=1903157 RepID=UPI002F3EE5CB
MAAFAGAACNFARDYEIAQEPLMREIERCVRGSDYGATSWTTHEQAEQAAARLGLVRGQHMLELGAGSGWPALFLATLSGCDVVLTDLPLSGLRIARERAARDGLNGRCSVLAADGAALPFADRSFDRIHHADVLCCMDRKREMLRECRRVARPGARMEFSVISLAREPGGDDERQLLQQSGPPYPDAGADYAVLLGDAGWKVLERIDVTAEFVRCMGIQLEESHARRSALLDLLGEADYAERLNRRNSTRAAVACGLLRREIFFAQPIGLACDAGCDRAARFEASSTMPTSGTRWGKPWGKTHLHKPSQLARPRRRVGWP